MLSLSLAGGRGGGDDEIERLTTHTISIYLFLGVVRMFICLHTHANGIDTYMTDTSCKLWILDTTRQRAVSNEK